MSLFVDVNDYVDHDKCRLGWSVKQNYNNFMNYNYDSKNNSVKTTTSYIFDIIIIKLIKINFVSYHYNIEALINYLIFTHYFCITNYKL